MRSHLSTCAGLFAAILFFGPIEPARAQELVIAPAHGQEITPYGDPVVVVADLAGGLPQPPLVFVAPPQTSNSNTLKPHGLALLSANVALVSHISNGFDGAIDIVDTALAQRIDGFSMQGYEADGLGTLAVNPAKTHLLVFSGLSNSKLFVVPAPFSSSSTASPVTMPSQGGSAQTRAIAFDAATGRAYVGHVAGISALDPPYSTIAFTIPMPPSAGVTIGRSVALSPDGSIMASTIYGDGKVQVLHAPFSAASTPTGIDVSGAAALDGLVFTPDGTQLLVVEGGVIFNPVGTTKAYAIAAPFDQDATIEVLDTGAAAGNTFEDIDISADGEYAALSGGNEDSDPLVILRAPFTAAGVQAQIIAIPALDHDYDTLGGRGTGTARFWSVPLAAPPQITLDPYDPDIAVTEGDSGTSPLLVQVSLSRAATQVVSIDYATADGSLTAPSRYIATSGTLTFAPGETRKAVSIPVVGDTVADGSGEFRVNFSNPVNASLLEVDASVVCNVIDNDDVLIITANSPLPDGYVGAPYSFAFTATGGPGGDPTWSGFGRNGLSIDPISGVASGVPVTAGTQLYRVSVSYSGGQIGTFRDYQLTVRSDRIFADGFDGRP